MRWITWILPAVLLSLLAIAWVTWGGARPVLGFRLFGGPLAGTSHLSSRLEVWRHDGLDTLPERGKVVDLTIRRGSAIEHQWLAQTDDWGMASLEVPLASELSVGDGLTLTIAAGGVTSVAPIAVLPTSQWEQDTRDVTWRITRGGELDVDVRAQHAVFAVPFAQRIHVTAVHGGKGVSAGVSAHLEGRGDVRTVRGETRVDGARVEPAAFDVEPGEHDVALSIEASAPGPGDVELRGHWFARLPIVPGAMEVRSEGSDTLLVRSPVPRRRAYLAVIDEQHRRWGAIVSLEERADGTSDATLPLPRGAVEGRAWAVVSSAPRLDSPSAVGWPIGAQHERPATTRRAPELVLADSLAPAIDQENRRQRGVQAWLFTATLLSGALTALWLLYAVRRSSRRLDAHLAEVAPGELSDGRVRDAQRSRLTLYAAMLLALFAAAGLWLWIYWRPL